MLGTISWIRRTFAALLICTCFLVVEESLLCRTGGMGLSETETSHSLQDVEDALESFEREGALVEMHAKQERPTTGCLGVLADTGRIHSQLLLSYHFFRPPKAVITNV